MLGTEQLEKRDAEASRRFVVVGLVADHGVHPALQRPCRIIGAEGIQAIRTRVLHGDLPAAVPSKGTAHGPGSRRAGASSRCAWCCAVPRPVCGSRCTSRRARQEAGLVSAGSAEARLSTRVGHRPHRRPQQLFDLGQSLLSTRGKMLLDALTKLRLRQGPASSATTSPFTKSFRLGMPRTS